MNSKGGYLPSTEKYLLSVDLQPALGRPHSRGGEAPAVSSRAAL